MLNSLYSESTKYTLTDTEKQTIISSLTTTLEFINKKGIFHRDIKPENIMICQDRSSSAPISEHDVILIDFGLALFIWDNEGNKVRHTAMDGTIGYIAPEML